jgi:putative transposon-encoded protein
MNDRFEIKDDFYLNGEKVKIRFRERVTER